MRMKNLQEMPIELCRDTARFYRTNNNCYYYEEQAYTNVYQNKRETAYPVISLPQKKSSKIKYIFGFLAVMSLFYISMHSGS